jgi:hypothetical protein
MRLISWIHSHGSKTIGLYLNPNAYCEKNGGGVTERVFEIFSPRSVNPGFPLNPCLLHCTYIVFIVSGYMYKMETSQTIGKKTFLSKNALTVYRTYF